ncbi:PIG-L family deacetylase [Devosia sp.]|uniref:PIG-L deacetylase family protein n=1 Tax=Devosia sp. TaxID=1871048 RepID=UPI00261B051B|nr:PIG-L family deacetylase [Devosia sp.]
MHIEVDACKRILVISPHLDDGVLSVGGIIERAVANGAEVIVATAFTADTPAGARISPLALELHALWDLGPNPFEQRRAEDVASVTSLGARVLHGNLLDALYRADQAGDPLYPTRQSVFGAPSDRDRIGDALVELFDAWISEISPDLVLSPLGVGRHVDHVLTTNAVRRLAMVRAMNVALYEDLPYATGLFPVTAPDSVEAALGRTQWQVTSPQVISVDLPGKLAAIGAYASQIADIFPNGLAFGSVLDTYMRREDGAFGERVWHTATS